MYFVCRISIRICCLKLLIVRGNQHKIIKLYPGTIRKSKKVSLILQYNNDKLTNTSEFTHTGTHMGMCLIIWRPAGLVAEIFHLPALLKLFLLMNLIYTAYCSLWLKLPTLFMYFSELKIISYAMGTGIFAKQLFIYIPTSPLQMFSIIFIGELKLFAYNKMEICDAEILCVTL